MNEPEHRVESRRWLRFAEEDPRAAETLIHVSGVLPRHVCWLAQQAAEKALKAILIFEQLDYPRRHDLDLLILLIPENWSARGVQVDLARLTEWSMEARYPGDWPDATDEDAHQAVTTAHTVVDAVMHDLAQRGISTEDAG
ncbi:MAG: HEPN domain-containing protein [Dehalococcoidia bacterium]